VAAALHHPVGLHQGLPGLSRQRCFYALDRGLPCYGWELHPFIPDYFVINGYDEDGDNEAGQAGGYFYSGWASGGPSDWRTLGDGAVKVLQVYAGRAIRDGHAYNTATWLECREMVVAFLHEARSRLHGRCDAAFTDAAGDYERVCVYLRQALALNPFDPATWDADTRLGSAQAAERQALVALSRILSLLLLKPHTQG
jgi:hypothetical protein